MDIATIDNDCKHLLHPYKYSGTW